MKEKLLNDSTTTFKPIIYQFYIALERCFDLIENESVFIEKYGDVTVSDDTQIEVKDFTSKLTDLDHNIWKTLKNWLDNDFDVSCYKSLILLTTQNYSNSTVFKNWNEKKKTEKRKLLDDINEKYRSRVDKSKKTVNLLETVLKLENENKLLEILDKFYISDSSLKDDEYYKYLKAKHCKFIPPSNSDSFLNALMGFIISPQITSNNWEITYKMFTSKVESLNRIYSSGTVVFPSKKFSNNFEEEDFSEHLFIKKIDDIKYDEVKVDAISDYLQANNIISKELSKYLIDKEFYDNYEEEIKKTYSNKYRDACLDTTPTNQIKSSKKFYNYITGLSAPNFIHFNDTPLYFKNGIIHSLADDEKENIVWKLKVEDE